jgi:hypothetical protein
VPCSSSSPAAGASSAHTCTRTHTDLRAVERLVHKVRLAKRGARGRPERICAQVVKGPPVGAQLRARAAHKRLCACSAAARVLGGCEAVQLHAHAHACARCCCCAAAARCRPQRAARPGVAVASHTPAYTSWCGREAARRASSAAGRRGHNITPAAPADARRAFSLAAAQMPPTAAPQHDSHRSNGSNVEVCWTVRLKTDQITSLVVRLAQV